MKFYVSWYSGDPWYPNFFPDCNMLISITSISQNWKLSRQKDIPASLIIDSGGFRFASNPQERITPKQAFQRQLKLLDYQPKEVFLCSLDYPILNMSCSDVEKDQCISKTIGYAYEFYELIKYYKGPIIFKPVAIVQGYDVNSLRFCARELRAIGFHNFGLGSMIPLRDGDELVRRVKAVTDEVGPNLHIFGITSMDYIKRLKKIDGISVDSTRPAKAAMYNQILFWENGNVLKVWESQDRNEINITDEKKREITVNCNCPVCGGKLNPEILKKGKRKHIYLRTIHNYWHLKEAITNS